MAHTWYDLLEETSATSGTGSFTLAGATSGHRAFSVVGNGNTHYYFARGSTFAEWEEGLGTWSTGGTLARTTILSSSNGGSAVNFTAGGVTIRGTAPAAFFADPISSLLGTGSQGDVIYRGASGWARLAAGTARQALKTGGASADPSWGDNLGDYVLVADIKTQNTQGGTFTSGAWRTRDINTEMADTAGICSISSNQITLAAGTYRFRICCPAIGVEKHQARLQNVSDATTVRTGRAMYSSSGVNVVNDAWVIDRFTIGSSKTFEVQHQCTTTRSTDGFGVAVNLAAETYTVAEFWRE